MDRQVTVGVILQMSRGRLNGVVRELLVFTVRAAAAAAAAAVKTVVRLVVV